MARWAIGRRLLFRFHVSSEIGKNGLPSRALHLDGVGIFRIERYSYRYFIAILYKFDPSDAVAEGIFDQAVFDDRGIDSGEIEAHAAILRLHPRSERPAHPQIHRGGSRVPIVGRGVPSYDVRGCRIGAPHGSDGCRDDGFDSDFLSAHGFTFRLDLCGGSNKLSQ